MGNHERLSDIAKTGQHQWTRFEVYQRGGELSKNCAHLIGILRPLKGMIMVIVVIPA